MKLLVIVVVSFGLAGASAFHALRCMGPRLGHVPIHGEPKMHIICFIDILFTFVGLVCGDISRPGGAGHALLFRDHGVVIEDFKDLAPDAFTFEAWVRTSDYCHRSALLSYALRPDVAGDEAARTLAANHLVIFDQAWLVGCHDFEYM